MPSAAPWERDAPKTAGAAPWEADKSSDDFWAKARTQIHGTMLGQGMTAREMAYMGQGAPGANPIVQAAKEDPKAAARVVAGVAAAPFTGGASLLGQMGVSALAGAGGEALGEKMAGEDFSPRDIGTSAAIGAVIPAAFRGAGAAVSGAVEATKRALQMANSPGGRAVLKVVSPRLGNALELADRIKDAVRTAGGAAAEAAPEAPVTLGTLAKGQAIDPAALEAAAQSEMATRTAALQARINAEYIKPVPYKGAPIAAAAESAAPAAAAAAVPPSGARPDIPGYVRMEQSPAVAEVQAAAKQLLSEKPTAGEIKGVYKALGYPHLWEWDPALPSRLEFQGSVRQSIADAAKAAATRQGAMSAGQGAVADPAAIRAAFGMAQGAEEAAPAVAAAQKAAGASSQAPTVQQVKAQVLQWKAKTGFSPAQMADALKIKWGIGLTDAKKMVNMILEASGG